MVQSSIVVPSSNARKRSLDSTNKTDSDATPDEEVVTITIKNFFFVRYFNSSKIDQTTSFRVK